MPLSKIDSASLNSPITVEGTLSAPTSLAALKLLTLKNASDGGVGINFTNAVAAQLASIDALVTSAGGGTDDGILAFSTATNAVNTERMRIDSAGRVTTPYQTSFAAYISGNTFSSSPIFDVVSFNVGNAYNSSTGTFTAPIAGTYLFNIWYRLNQTNTTFCQVTLARNGSNTGWNGGYINTTTVNTTYATPSVSVAYYLSAGDTVKPSAAVSGGTPSVSGNESWFNGYLLG
jgi:hypothetical protein